MIIKYQPIDALMAKHLRWHRINFQPICHCACIYTRKVDSGQANIIVKTDGKSMDYSYLRDL